MGDGTAPTASPEEAIGGATCIAPSAGGVSATASTAVDTLERFTDRLKGRIDTEQAIRLLADPHCRPGPLRRFIRNARGSVRRRVRNAIAFAK